MADKNDINSTEKLLNVIRGNKEEGSGPIVSQNISLKKKYLQSQTSISVPKLITEKKNYTVGVDIGHEFIRLAKTIKASDGRPVLIDQRVIRYSDQADKDSPEFNTLLKTSLLSFCGNISKCNIWTMITAAEVNVHHIKIPRVQKKQLENAIYWTAKKENSFDEKEFMFDYELQGEIVDQGIPKISVMVYTAPKAEIEKIRNLYAGIGVNLTGITIAPFAIQNIFRTKWMQTGDGAVATLFIGNEFSRIDIYTKDNLVMTRGIKTGTSSMIEAIAETMLEKNNLSRLDSKETYKILLSLSPDSEKLKETDAGFGLKDEEILAMIFPALERLTRQVERTLQYYTASVGHDRVEKLYVSSAMNHYAPIIYYISEQLGVKGEEFDPFIQQTSNHSITSLSISEKTALVPVLGLSFSDNARTPNLIFTYREKSKEIGIKRINRGIFAVFAAAIVICSITIIYNFFDYEILNNKKNKLQQELSMYNPLLSSEKISQLANEVKSKKQISRQYAERYMGMAVIGEIATITPDNIKLINFKIFSPQIKEKAENTSKDEREGIALEGIIIGERNMLDSYLAQYVMKLGSSPILRQVTVQKSNMVNFKKGEVLQFSIDAGIGKPL